MSKKEKPGLTRGPVFPGEKREEIKHNIYCIICATCQKQTFNTRFQSVKQYTGILFNQTFVQVFILSKHLFIIISSLAHKNSDL